MKKFISKYNKMFAWFFWIWLVILITISSLPNIPTQHAAIGGDIYRLDYLFHFGAYGLLTMFLHLWKFKKYEGRKTQMLFMAIFLILFATGDEFHQLIIPGRTFNFVDLYCNIGGIIAGTLLFAAVFFNKRRFLFAE
jgi:VanZ family protein